MQPLTDDEIRRSFRNGSRGERSSISLPDLRSQPWDELAYLGWRDPRAPLRAALVHGTPDGPVGLLLRAPETRVRRAAQCLLCHTVQQDGVALFTAARAGAAGRRGSTLGTYVCAELDCSAQLRAAHRPSRRLPDPAPVLAARVQELQERLSGFLASVLHEEQDTRAG